MYHIFRIHSSVEGHIGCFQILRNKAAMNIVEQVSLLYGGVSFRYVPRSCLAGSSELRIPKLQHTDYMKLNKKEGQSVDASILHRRGDRVIMKDRARERPG